MVWSGRAIVLVLLMAVVVFAKPQVVGAKPQAAGARGTQPNIVFIFIDDLGYNDLGSYGNPDIKTPHLDKFAAQGLSFSQFYVASPICSPSRVGVTTGMYPARWKINSYLNSRARNAARGMANFLDPKAPAIARAFKEAGYATAHVGKWHMGGGRDVGDAPLPQAYGFDESLTSFEGLGDRLLPPGGLSAQSEKLGRGKITHTPKHKMTEIYVDRCINFIDRNKDNKFYLHLWLNDVHDGHVPSESQLKKFERFSANPYLQKFYGVLDEMDRQLGRLIAHIDKLGLDDNTLIVVTGDNGPTAWSSYEKRGFDAPGHVGELRGRKWSLYEGGIRQPLIVRWKGKTPIGQRDETSVLTAVDFFPTFCKIAGVALPNAKFDGEDMSTALLGTPNPFTKPRTKPIYWEYGRDETYLQPARPLDRSPNLAVRDGKWKLLMQSDGSRVELYDMAKSPREYHNVAGANPEVRDRLIKQLTAWKDTLPNYPKTTKSAAKLGEAKTFVLKAGQTLSGEAEPTVSDAAITVAAQVERAKGNAVTKGVIVAHGGQAAGYALYVEDNKPVFTVRVRDKAVTIRSQQPLPQGKVLLHGLLLIDGTMLLHVNNDEVAKGKSALLNVQPVDPLNVGKDEKGNVGDYQGEFPFTGTFHAGRVVVSKSAQFSPLPHLGHMVTRWAGDVNNDAPLPEYPRPQMVRDKWLNLNGQWQYAIVPRDTPLPKKWQGRIVVPFAVESLLSGVQRAVGAENKLWYRRTFDVPKDWDGQRVLLHFGAVDWHAIAWINGKQVGEHRGGYDPFSFDITNALKRGEANEIVVSVWDPSELGAQPRGKQVSTPQGIWFTPVTGIWQTVWLEPVPSQFIRNIQLKPDLDAGTLAFSVDVVGEKDDLHFNATVDLGDGRSLGVGGGEVGKSLNMVITKVAPWTPSNPHLYPAEIVIADKSGVVDRVKTYFAMRKIERRKDKQGIDRLFLNNKPVFHFGPLDQGWWPDGLYTAPTDDALRYDIEVTKQLGFNMARKHVKVEPARWYYHCDKLGLMVWQDMPSGMEGAMGGTLHGNGGGPNHVQKGQPDIELSNDDAAQFKTELKAMIDSLHNHPCIVAWIPFNEGWGQHNTNAILKWTKQHDPARIVGGPSGWEDRGFGDMIDMHRYPGPDMFPVTKDRASVLGEYGGLGWPVNGHLWITSDNWGYRTYKTQAELQQNYEQITAQLPDLIRKGLAAAIYTQTTDVEVEVNGFLTYDRNMIKLNAAKLKAMHERVISTGHQK